MSFTLKCGILLIVILNLARADDDKYEMFVDKLELIKGKEILAATEIKVEKTGPTNFVFRGEVEHFKEFNDDWTLALKVFKANTADEGFKPLINYPTKGTKGVCTVLKNEYKKLFYDSIKDCSTAPHFDTCPLKEAKYTFNDCSFDAGVFKKFLNKGYYLIQVHLSHLEEADLVQYDLYAHVETDK
ncbi:uncharacterized protein LOC129916473 [Episyrphus balteatus]|uniref:uncharacterized protein LOC129916473 n=1 Tax=Episyrphus balteatus TaxID=286459 RepID=UPI002486A78E|nr:uncharacterized protein LOC129916473 [Episyrphus balteatus]